MKSKFNINEADLRSLVARKGIGETYGKRILEERDARGGFENPKELLTLDIPWKNMLEFFRDVIVTVGDEVEESLSHQVEFDTRVHLRNPKNGGFCFKEFIVHVSYEVLTPSVSDGPQSCHVLRSLTIEEGNTAVFRFIPDHECLSDVEVTVKRPNGETCYHEILAEADFFVEELTIKIELSEVLLARITDVNPFTHNLRGCVLDLNGKAVMEEVQVIVFGSTAENPQDDDFTPLAVTTTEANGHFTIGCPEGKFTAAYAHVGIEGKNKVPIHLEKDETGKGTLPRRIIVVVEPEEGPDETGTDDECSDLQFKAAKQVLEEFSFHTVVRTTEPEVRAVGNADEGEISLKEIAPQEELLYQTSQMMAFTQRPQGKSLSQPAKTFAWSSPQMQSQNLGDYKVKVAVLREFLAAHGLIKDIDDVQKLFWLNERYRQRRLIEGTGVTSGGRILLGPEISIDWDDDPTTYEAVTVAHGHLLNFKQEWIADGYSLGDLLYSLPLAPGQKKQLVIYDWERRESAANMQSIDYEESLANSLSRDRDVNEIAKGSVRESVTGGSESNVWGWGVGGGVGAIIPSAPVGALVGAGGGGGGSNAKAWQKSSRSTSASSLQQLRDRTVQSANAVRSQRSTVIQTVTQGERFSVQAESVANYNHCHALTIEYFEVLRHFKIQQRLAGVQECLLIPLRMSKFSADKALRWREVLSRYLVNRSLRKGFAALQRIQRDYEGSDLPEGSFADEDIVYMKGDLKLRFQLARPKLDWDDLEVGVAESEAIGALWGWMSWTGRTPRDFWDRYLRGQKNKDDIFARVLGPEIAKRIVDECLGLEISGHLIKDVDFTLISDFRNNRDLLVNIKIPEIPAGMKTRNQIDRYEDASIKLSLSCPPAGPNSSTHFRDYLPEGSRVMVSSFTLQYRTRHMNHVLVQDRRVNDDLTGTDSVSIFIPPPSQAELRDPRAEDIEVVNELIRHLNDNLEYYHRAIWMEMDSERRFMFLDGIVAPGCKAHGRSVASVVENKVVGIVGNCLVMPVAPGFQLDPTYEPEVINAETGEEVSLLDYYNPEPQDPISISVPTKGVFAEAVMGRSNSAEKIEEERFWRWHEVPIPDSPTEIQPVGTETRRADLHQIDIEPMVQPIVNLMNAPSAPDPTGLGAAFDLLGKSGVFKDITGLTETQKNALAAFQRSLQTAETFGKEASALTKLAGQMHMSEKGADKTLSKIEKAKKQGLLDEESAQELAKDAINSTIPNLDEDNLTLKYSDPIEEAIRKASEAPESEIRVDSPGGQSVVVSKGTPAKGSRSTTNSSANTPGVERVIRFFSTYPGTSIPVTGLYDVGFRHAITDARDSGSFSIRTGDGVGYFRTHLPSGDWDINGRIQADLPESVLTVPVNVVPGLAPFDFVAEREFAAGVVPLDIVGRVSVKNSTRVIDICLEPTFETVTVNREIEMSASATTSAQLNAEAKAGVEAEAGAILANAKASGELTFGTQYELSGNLGAGQTLTLAITYKRVTGFKLDQK